MATTNDRPWYDIEAESLIDVALADAEREYCSETGDQFWTCGFTDRFEGWLERNGESDLALLA
jgi:hypothetical protein